MVNLKATKQTIFWSDRIRTLSLKPFGYMFAIFSQVHLGTLATGCQSPAALQQLMDSGFLTILSTALCEFCNTEMLKHSDSLSHPEVFTDAARSRQLNQNEATTSASSNGSSNATDAASPPINGNSSVNTGTSIH